MAEFKQAFENTLKFEDARLSGKVTVDAGGRTRFGIAEKFHPDLPDEFFSGPREAALAEAEAIEEREYWTPMNLGKINSQVVANKLFDMAVNMGVRQACVLAQRVVNAKAAGILVEDGVIGAKTLAAINTFDPARFVQVLRALSVEFYWHVASLHPAEAVDLAGWIKRAES